MLVDISIFFLCVVCLTRLLCVCDLATRRCHPPIASNCAQGVVMR